MMWGDVVGLGGAIDSATPSARGGMVCDTCRAAACGPLVLRARTANVQ